MTIKKRRTKEQIIRDTFANAKKGEDLLPLLRYAHNKSFTIVPGRAIRTADDNCQCPLEAVMSFDGRGIYDLARKTLGLTDWSKDIPDGTFMAMSQFINAADRAETSYPALRKSILDSLGIVETPVVQNVGSNAGGIADENGPKNGFSDDSDGELAPV